MTAIDVLLTRLEGVRKSGRGWIARCPAHGDKSPSLSVTDIGDGKVLVHCFAGCDVHSIVGALGLTVADLFPARLQPSTSEDRRRIRLAKRQTDWAAALNVLGRECTITLLAAKTLALGGHLGEGELSRLNVAAHRIGRAREVLIAP